MNRRVYLDHAATTPIDREVLTAMLPYYGEVFGNAASVHYHGRQAKAALDTAREQVARLMNAEPSEILFTSGGTEADNWAIKGIADRADSQGHIVTSSAEHHAVLDTCAYLEKKGMRVTYLPVDRFGMVHPDQVADAIEDDTLLISIMYVNNEVGSINPVREIGAIARSKEIVYHTDGVQAYGRIPVDVHRDNINLMSISGHKIYGPKGIGALYCQKGTQIKRLMHGGAQERGKRSGTVNVPAIVGLGKAAEICGQCMQEETERLTRLSHMLFHGLEQSVRRVTLNGHPEKRQPGNVHLSFEGADGQELLLALDMQGVSVSTGSACMSGSIEPSHVLKAMGYSLDSIYNTLRMTLGRHTTEEDIKYVLQILPEIVARIRESSEESIR